MSLYDDTFLSKKITLIYRKEFCRPAVAYLTEWIVVLPEEGEGEVVVDQHHHHGRQEGGRAHREEGKAR